MSAQRDMWKAMPDPNFVANPSKGSRHSYGEAVDLTLVDAFRPRTAHAHRL